jgi:hypothetical protein
MIDVQADEFKKYYRQISNVDAEVRKALRKNLMEAAKPVVEKVRQAALAIPSKGGEAVATRKKKGESLGLRQSLAAATKADLNATGRGAGVHIRVSRSKFASVSGRPGGLPYYVDKRVKKPWRHPVFADAGASKGSWKGAWVTQPAHPFLGVTASKYRKEYEKAVSKATVDALKACHIDIK